MLKELSLRAQQSVPLLLGALKSSFFPRTAWRRPLASGYQHIWRREQSLDEEAVFSTLSDLRQIAHGSWMQMKAEMKTA